MDLSLKHGKYACIAGVRVAVVAGTMVEVVGTVGFC